MNAATEVAILIATISGIVHVTAQEGSLTLEYASLVSLMDAQYFYICNPQRLFATGFRKTRHLRTKIKIKAVAIRTGPYE